MNNIQFKPTEFVTIIETVMGKYLQWFTNIPYLSYSIINYF